MPETFRIHLEGEPDLHCGLDFKEALAKARAISREMATRKVMSYSEVVIRREGTEIVGSREGATGAEKTDRLRGRHPSPDEGWPSLELELGALSRNGPLYPDGHMDVICVQGAEAQLGLLHSSLGDELVFWHFTFYLRPATEDETARHAAEEKAQDEAYQRRCEADPEWQRSREEQEARERERLRVAELLTGLFSTSLTKGIDEIAELPCIRRVSAEFGDLSYDVHEIQPIHGAFIVTCRNPVSTSTELFGTRDIVEMTIRSRNARFRITSEKAREHLARYGRGPTTLDYILAVGEPLPEPVVPDQTGARPWEELLPRKDVPPKKDQPKESDTHAFDTKSGLFDAAAPDPSGHPGCLVILAVGVSLLVGGSAATWALCT